MCGKNLIHHGTITVLVFTTHLVARAGTTDTNATAALRTMADQGIFLLKEPERLSLDFVPRFEQEFVRNQLAYQNTFGQQTYMGWTIQWSRNPWNMSDQVTKSGISMLSRWAQDSAQETAMTIIPIESLQASGEFFAGRLADAIFGSFGNTSEQWSHMTSVLPEWYENSWLNYKPGEVVRFGVRPLRPDPYFYMAFRAGHLEGRSLLEAEARCGYDMFGSGRVEGRVALALPEHFRLAVGVSVHSILSINGFSNPDVLWARIERPISSRHELAAYCGVQTNRIGPTGDIPPQSRIVLGLFKTW